MTRAEMNAAIAKACGKTLEEMQRQNAEACERIANSIEANGGRDAHGNSAATFRAIAKRLRASL